MTERPIIFSGPMIRAILDGTKRQTRRVFKEAKPNWRLMTPEEWMAATPNRPAIGGYPKPPKFPALMWDGRGGVAYASPYGVPGDRLYVRENFYFTNVKGHERSGAVIFAADHPGVDRPPMGVGRPWRPSIFMPRWASRITLEIVDVHVERLQEITGDDARAEGVLHVGMGIHVGHIQPHVRPIKAFRDLWDSINAKKAPWSDNPFVWVIHFNVKNHI